MNFLFVCNIFKIILFSTLAIIDNSLYEIFSPKHIIHTKFSYVSFFFLLSMKVNVIYRNIL